MGSTTTKHTPGPWSVCSSLYLHMQAEICAPDTSKVDGKRGIAQVWRSERADADAHLIAAAPELLTALEVMVNLYAGQITNEGGYHPELIDAARAAIAKAHGTGQ